MAAAPDQDQEKREMHNDYERKRRGDLMDAYTALRDEIPELRHCANVSRNNIVTGTIKYIDTSEVDNRKTRHQIHVLNDRVTILKEKLEALKKAQESETLDIEAFKNTLT